MNIKAYIDFFEEISELKRDQQFDLLMRARDEILASYRWSVFNMVSLLGPVFSILLIVGTSYFIFGLSILSLFISVIIALLISKVFVTEINSRLLRKGLKKVMD